MTLETLRRASGAGDYVENMAEEGSRAKQQNLIRAAKQMLHTKDPTKRAMVGAAGVVSLVAGRKHVKRGARKVKGIAKSIERAVVGKAKDAIGAFVGTTEGVIDNVSNDINSWLDRQVDVKEVICPDGEKICVLTDDPEKAKNRDIVCLPRLDTTKFNVERLCDYTRSAYEAGTKNDKVVKGTVYRSKSSVVTAVDPDGTDVNVYSTEQDTWMPAEQQAADDVILQPGWRAHQPTNYLALADEEVEITGGTPQHKRRWFSKRAPTPSLASAGSDQLQQGALVVYTGPLRIYERGGDIKQSVMLILEPNYSVGRLHRPMSQKRGAGAPEAAYAQRRNVYVFPSQYGEYPVHVALKPTEVRLYNATPKFEKIRDEMANRAQTQMQERWFQGEPQDGSNCPDAFVFDAERKRCNRNETNISPQGLLFAKPVVRTLEDIVNLDSIPTLSDEVQFGLQILEQGLQVLQRRATENPFPSPADIQANAAPVWNTLLVPMGLGPMTPEQQFAQGWRDYSATWMPEAEERARQVVYQGPPLLFADGSQIMPGDHGRVAVASDPTHPYWNNGGVWFPDVYGVFALALPRIFYQYLTFFEDNKVRQLFNLYRADGSGGDDDAPLPNTMVSANAEPMACPSYAPFLCGGGAVGTYTKKDKAWNVYKHIGQRVPRCVSTGAMCGLTKTSALTDRHHDDRGAAEDHTVWPSYERESQSHVTGTNFEQSSLGHDPVLPDEALLTHTSPAPNVSYILQQKMLGRKPVVHTVDVADLVHKQLLDSESNRDKGRNIQSAEVEDAKNKKWGLKAELQSGSLLFSDALVPANNAQEAIMRVVENYADKNYADEKTSGVGEGTWLAVPTRALRFQ